MRAAPDSARGPPQSDGVDNLIRRSFPEDTGSPPGGNIGLFTAPFNTNLQQLGRDWAIDAEILIGRQAHVNMHTKYYIDGVARAMAERVLPARQFFFQSGRLISQILISVYPRAGRYPTDRPPTIIHLSNWRNTILPTGISMFRRGGCARFSNCGLTRRFFYFRSLRESSTH